MPAGTPEAPVAVPAALNRMMEPLYGGSDLAKALFGVNPGTGTVTNWRLVSNEGREYLEITLGW